MKRTLMLIGSLAWLTLASANAQLLNLHLGSGQKLQYAVNEIDSITLSPEPEKPDNLWDDSKVKLTFFYSDANWQQLSDPKYSYSRGTYTITFPTATQLQWQAQAFFLTNIATTSDNTYDFSITLKSNKTIGNATVKLHLYGNDELYYFADRINLQADEPYTFTKTGMDGIDMSQLRLVLDFGGNPAGTTIQVCDISMKASGSTEEFDLTGYRKVWYDEFNGSTLSSSKWTFQTAGAGWVNHELQTYVTSKTPSGTKVAEVSDGTLKIRAVKEGNTIYSARIYGRRTVGFKYCYIEASIKLPQGKGTWPAFWMMPVGDSNWPSCGEIDIMEEVGYNPNVIHSTIHCTKYNNSGTSIETGTRRVATAESDFHLYAMEWTAEQMTFYVDGHKILTYRNDGTPEGWPFDKTFYPILNLAWGGDWGGAQGVDESALPAVMEVDYIRVYQK